MKHSPSLAASAAPVSASRRSDGAQAPAASGGSSELTQNFVTPPQKRALRVNALAMKRAAATILRPHDEKRAGRIAACGYVAWSPSVDLARVVNSGGDASGRLNGLVSCSNVWLCPVCSARISAKRRDELNHLLGWARAEGHAVVMLTLTMRHGQADKLAELLDALRMANASFRQSRAFRRLGLVGSVTATEVTHGANGFHPHLHCVLILPASIGDACAAIEALRPEWMRSLAKAGRDGNGAAFQVQNASATGDYVAKFGAAEEIALGRCKAGRKGSRSPWQLLADARDGDRKAVPVWVEYAKAMKGKAQLVWSRGLKAACALADVPDADAGTVEDLRSWPGNSDEWRAARRRRAALLTAAESGEDLDRAEFGPTDAARWRADVHEAEVVDNDASPAYTSMAVRAIFCPTFGKD